MPRVRCINTGGYHYLRLGGIYDVEEYNFEDFYYGMFDDTNFHSVYRHRFEIVEEEQNIVETLAIDSIWLHHDKSWI